MGLKQFLDKQEKLKKEIDSKKEAFNSKCRKTLEQIKKYNEERYQELANTFTAQYDNINVKRKKLQGFYAHLMAELKELKQQAGETPEVKNFSKKAHDVVESAHKGFKTVEKKAKENIKKKTAKKPEKKAEIKDEKKATKKTAKKTAEKSAKKTVKKEAKKTKKKTKKKTAEKSAKKTAKKTTKSTPKKAAKKTAKKTAKKSASKTTKKKK
jgi:DNA polymerase III gamma/tau subunit